MSKIQKKSKLKDGFTIIEVLIAISLVAFSLVAILSAFIYQGKVNNSINNKNVAIVLAEEKLEEFFKFPYTDMPGNETDYIVYELNRNPMITDAEGAKRGNSFERIVTVVEGIYTSRIRVQVNYGYSSGGYDFSVVLETVKGG